MAQNIPENPFHTHTYHSPLDNVEQFAEPCILGVDEAGRGPVIGPMVYACAYCPLSYKDDLAKCGYDDSKALTAKSRDNLLEKIIKDSHVGWTVKGLGPRDIGAGMLRPKSINYNLNAQAHDATISMIQEVLGRGVKIVEVYVDTVGPPVTYQEKLSRRFPGIRFTVSKKADSIYPIVSAASICAKVTRDAWLTRHEDKNEGGWGSGYPSDPNTVKYLKRNVDPLFGFSGNIRFSWGTITDLMKKEGIEVQWTDDYDEDSKKKVKNAAKFFVTKDADESEKKDDELLLSTEWYGSDGGRQELWL